MNFIHVEMELISSLLPKSTINQMTIFMSQKSKKKKKQKTNHEQMNNIYSYL